MGYFFSSGLFEGIFVLFFIVFIAVFLSIVVRGLTQWNKNNPQKERHPYRQSLFQRSCHSTSSQIM